MSIDEVITWSLNAAKPSGAGNNSPDSSANPDIITT